MSHIPTAVGTTATAMRSGVVLAGAASGLGDVAGPAGTTPGTTPAVVEPGEGSWKPAAVDEGNGTVGVVGPDAVESSDATA